MGDLIDAGTVFDAKKQYDKARRRKKRRAGVGSSAREIAWDYDDELAVQSARRNLAFAKGEILDRGTE